VQSVSKTSSVINTSNLSMSNSFCVQQLISHQKKQMQFQSHWQCELRQIVASELSLETATFLSGETDGVSNWDGGHRVGSNHAGETKQPAVTVTIVFSAVLAHCCLWTMT